MIEVKTSSERLIFVH